MKKSRLLGTFCAALCTLTTLSAQAVTVPAGLNPGDTYQLAFVTAGLTAATSTDIAFYNSFVQTEAEANPAFTGTDIGVTYTAIGGTSTVAGNVNALVSGPVYIVDGSALIATSFADFWDGTLNSPIQTDQNGTLKGFVTADEQRAWTGFLADGVLRPAGGALGEPANVISGINNRTNDTWAASTSRDPALESPMYALSSVITVSAVPVPAAVWLFGSGLLGLIGVARRKARA